MHKQVWHPLIMLLQVYILTLASAALSIPTVTGGAGYDTSRVGPDNANCNRQTYQLDITSNNIVFKNVDSNANTVGSLPFSGPFRY